MMYSEEDEESIEHVLMRCTAYRSEREQLWEVMEVECEGWMAGRRESESATRATYVHGGK